MPVFDGIRIQVSNINGRLDESREDMALIKRRAAVIQEKFEKGIQLVWYLSLERNRSRLTALC